MIEAEIRTYLAAALSPVPVLMETPEDVPAKYVRIERTGGGRENFLYSSTFAIQSISAESLLDAATLNDAVVTAMLVMAGGTVSECRLNSTYDFTDSDTKTYRYQAVFQIYHY